MVSIFWISNKSTNKEIISEIDNKVQTVSTNSTTTPSLTNKVEEVSVKEFSFAVEADPHMDEQSDANVYKLTLQNIVKSDPDFLVDLGDIFMVDKLADKSEANINARYVLMKNYYNLLGSIPLYFALGNHDGETGWDTLNTKNYRQKYFPDSTYEKNYFSIEKENALFVILDPYSYTTKKPNSDGWGWTLGNTQYDWLKTTLEKSSAKYKFVFIHQLVGGDSQGRGGIEFAQLYEWGGNNSDGSYGFNINRPGWGKPIHRLLTENKVNIVFKGHDHFYAKQELDGVVYQTVPQPSHPGEKINTAGEYGYQNGEILGGSGYLKVQISETGGKIEFIKADGSVAYNYSIN